MKRDRRAGVARAACCRWVDVIGRNPAQLKRVRTRLALPPRLVALSLVDHLQPTVIRVQPAWFLVTYFTTPSRRDIFARHPLCLWLAKHAIVTISPWARRLRVLGATGELDETRDDFLCRIVAEAVNSHEEVGRHISEAFLAPDRGESPHTWHQKERRLVLFGRLLDHQLDFLRAVGLTDAKMRKIYEQLAGLAQIAHYTDRKLRESGYCRLCRHDEAIGRRRDR
jgi:hypothetical protein